VFGSAWSVPLCESPSPRPGSEVYGFLTVIFPCPLPIGAGRLPLSEVLLGILPSGAQAYGLILNVIPKTPFLNRWSYIFGFLNTPISLHGRPALPGSHCLFTCKPNHSSCDPGKGFLQLLCSRNEISDPLDAPPPRAGSLGLGFSLRIKLPHSTPFFYSIFWFFALFFSKLTCGT